MRHDSYSRSTPTNGYEHGGWTTTATAEYVYKGVKGTVILDEDDENFWVRKA